MDAGAPGPAGDKPALIEIDATHLFVVFSAQESSRGVALRGAMLDTATPKTIEGFAIDASEVGRATASHSQPSLTRAGDRMYLAWRSSGGDSGGRAEEIWLKEIAWSSSAGAIALELNHAAVPLPRAEANRAGDQRRPELATAMLWPNGALATIWQQYGGTLGGSGPNVAVGLIPLPLLRLPENRSAK